ncbi:MAG: phosphatase PAP2 family protein [Rhodothermales bacterium]|nr:phosphatase PAP2 family protein [Rhodothermales bacterium]MBO6779886.1 phosphatase PAP2 family protein [Rhodothermales bacterium]
MARSVFGGADYTAYPVYYGALPALWAPVVLGDADNRTAVRMTATMLGSYGAVVALKRLVRRPRPVAVHDWVIRRPAFPGGRDLDTWSWPSGHATLAAAVVGTLAFRHQRAAVTVPAVIWAGAVGGSRIWLGVHYPSDVLSGWALGAGMAWVVHQMRKNDEAGSLSEQPVFRFTIPLG